MLSFAQRHAITDVCVLVRDVEASVTFYRDKLGFSLKHRATGFADFYGAGVTLALWESAHIGQHAGVAVTQDHYGHLAASDMAKVVSKIDGVVSAASQMPVSCQWEKMIGQPSQQIKLINQA